MKEVKILHTADLHIGAAESFLKEGAHLRRMETLITFEKIIDLGLENGVRLIAIAGDLFDSNKIEERFIKAVFEKIAAAAPVKVVFAAGNHDPLTAESPFMTLKRPENLYVLGAEDECITFDDLSLRVYGRSFDSAFLKGEKKFALIPEKDDFINLMVQHGELKSDRNSDYNAITPEFVKSSGMDYIALGHIHTKTEIARLGDTFFAYSGCPEGQGFDETDQKGVYIGSIGKGHCRFEFVPVSKRLHIHEKIDISDCSESDIYPLVLERLSDRYGEGFAQNLYKIELTGSISPEMHLDLSELTVRLNEELYYAKLKDSTEYAIDIEALAEEISLKGIFVKKMLQKEREADEEEKPLVRKALQIGLRAFYSEVSYNED